AQRAATEAVGGLPGPSRRDRGPPSGVPARAARAVPDGQRRGVQRGAGQRRRGQLRQAAQGPVIPALERYPWGGLRRGPVDREDRARAGAEPAPRGRPGRCRQPGPRAGRVRRLRHPRLPHRGAVRRRPVPGGRGDQRTGRATHRRACRGRRRGGHLDRGDRHPGVRRAARRRPAHLLRCHQYPELRSVRAVGTRQRRRAQGRPRHRAADPVVPRTPQVHPDRVTRNGGWLMNLLTVGVSHRTAPVPVLEQLAASPGDVPDLLADLLTGEFIGEALVLSTCNRVEVYAGVSGFHGGLTEIVAVLARRAGCTPTELAPYAYVHYDTEAVRHAYRVATGLDSMVVGEAQILGQLRDA